MKQVVPSEIGLLTSPAAVEDAVEDAAAAEQAEGMLVRVKQLVGALKREDWQRLRRLGEGLAKTSKQAGHERVCRRAEGVCRALDRPHNFAGIRRSLIELVGACGNAAGGLHVYAASEPDSEED